MPALDASQGLAHWLPDSDSPLVQGSIADHLRRNAGERPQQAAIFWLTDSGDIARLSFAELLAAAERYAHWLLERAKPGDRIAIWSTNSIEFAVLLYASSLAGTIVAAFNTGWSDAEARHAHDLVEPCLLLVGRDTRGQDLAERAAFAVDCPILPLARLFDMAPVDAGSPLPAIQPDDPYLIQFTSGTTGRAKGALISQHAALAGGNLVMGFGDPGPRDIYLFPVPFHHIAGSCSIPLGALSSGGAYVVLERFDVKKMILLMRAVGATRMGGVPTMWHDLLRDEEFPDDVKVDIVALGGSKVPPPLVLEIEARTGAAVSIGYGQSECGAIMSTRIDDDLVTKAQTVGRGLPHVEVRIADPETGATLRFGEAGEIRARSPAIMQGYWGDPQATARAFDHDGFLCTGDLAMMAENGVCRILGRTVELIIRGGENIYPIEIEEALLQHPAVLRAAIIGLPDPRLGQKVAAVIEIAPGASAAIDDLREHAAGLVSHFKVPVEWRIIPAMPMTASGKVRKIELPGLFTSEARDPV